MLTVMNYRKTKDEVCRYLSFIPYHTISYFDL